jgi:hypothetical protein
MATETIPELQESSVIDSNSLFLFDSGVQTFKVTAPNVAAGLQKLFTNPIAVSTQAQLVAALATCVTNVGGVIQILQGFSLTTIHTVPTNTKIIGTKGSSVMSVGTGGGVILSDGSELQDLFFSTTLNDSSSVIRMSSNYSVIRGCKVAASAGNLVTGVIVTGNANKIHNAIFSGVAGQPNTHGIDYAGGADNGDVDCVFLS